MRNLLKYVVERKYENAQFNVHRNINHSSSMEGDKNMSRQRAIAQIKSVEIIYNGNKKTFEIFIESMILDYLNSYSIAKSECQCFIGKVESS